MRIKGLVSAIGGLFCFLSTYGQGIPGYNVSNYAGVSGVFLQPASIADSRYKVDISLVGAGLTLGNNYVSVTRKWYNYIDYAGNTHYQYVPDWKEAGLIMANDNSASKAINLGQYITLPSFMVSLGRSSAIAFTERERFYFNLDHISPDLAKLSYNALDIPTLLNTKLNDNNFNLNTMAWMEWGATYAKVINNKGPITMKAGATVKVMEGLGAAYFYARDLNYSWKNSDTLNLFKSRFGYGASNNVDNIGKSKNARDLIAKTPLALGFDFGFELEWRPNYKKYQYNLDGKEGLLRRDKNKYKLKVGASLVDLGRIKFTRSQYSSDFNADVQDWDVNKLKFDTTNPVKALGDTIKNHFGFQQTKGDFYMTLPTALSIQADYNISGPFYLNFTSYISPRFIQDESKVHALNYYTLGPRWDTKWFGVMVPVSMNAYGQMHIGTTLRLGPLIVGTTNIGAFLYSKSVTGYDIHMALKIPIFQRAPRDRDHDGVSNKKDACPDQPGTLATKGCPDKDGDGIADKNDNCPDVFGSPKAHGCPDFDNDSVPDKEDDCPAIAGTVKAHGCPDMDNDGIPDKDDLCKDLAGTVENRGCPDTDGDGIIDIQDDCPNVKGTKENHGCPPMSDRDNDGVVDTADKCPDLAGDVKHAGCPDTDGDGVYDNVDNCPNQKGPVSNHGCPVVEQVKDSDGDGVADKDDKCPTVAGSPDHHGCPDTDGDGVFDDEDNCPKTPGPASSHGCPEVKKADQAKANTAKTNLEFENGSARILPSSYPALDELAKVMTEHPEYRLRVAGYTDNIGTPAHNMLLSRQRAIQVQVYLNKKGIDPGRVDIEGHGQNDPIDTNATPEGRKHNRRVEIELKYE
jgi:outer membrane protein OmpA-like peptidoglycan-associated protein